MVNEFTQPTVETKKSPKKAEANQEQQSVDQLLDTISSGIQSLLQDPVLPLNPRASARIDKMIEDLTEIFGSGADFAGTAGFF